MSHTGCQVGKEKHIPGAPAAKLSALVELLWDQMLQFNVPDHTGLIMKEQLKFSSDFLCCQELDVKVNTTLPSE